jgi:hypothetical protein
MRHDTEGRSTMARLVAILATTHHPFYYETSPLPMQLDYAAALAPYPGIAT